MSVLDFPSRFALLARSWKFNHTSHLIIDALKIKKDVLSKYVSGDTKNLNNSASFNSLTRSLAVFLERQGFLQRHNISQEEFIRAFSDPDDMNFIQFLATQHELPIPHSVRSATRNDVSALARDMVGNFLLYRLGVDKLREPARHDPKVTMERRIPVLRRIPFRVEDIGASYLTYRDAFAWYGVEYQPAVASGYIFYTRSHICVFAEDVNARNQSDLFMMQIRDLLIDSADKANPLREGVIVMNGDARMPTAAKVIARKVSDEFQTMPWDEFSEVAGQKIELTDNDNDGVFEVANPEQNVEMIGDTPMGSKTYSWYANRLQIRSYKVHISFGDDQL